MTEFELAAPVHVSTDSFPDSQRIARWREIYGRNIAHVDIEPLDDQPFRAEAAFLTLPGLTVAVGSRSHSRYVIGKLGAAKAQDLVVLSLMTKGLGHVSQLGREASGGPGSAILLSGAEQAAGTLRDDGACVTLTLPHAALKDIVPDIGAAFARQIPKSNPALRLLIDYLGALRGGVGAMDAALAQAFSKHVLDLTALAVGACGEPREIAVARGAKAAWRRAILAEIDARAHAADASAPRIARKLGISDRYLRVILEETGKTFSELVLERRLVFVWRRLIEPRFDGQTISEIALAAGFSDISTFNRSFRRRFGDTPTGVRGVGQAIGDERAAAGAPL